MKVYLVIEITNDGYIIHKLDFEKTVVAVYKNKADAEKHVAECKQAWKDCDYMFYDIYIEEHELQ